MTGNNVRNRRKCRNLGVTEERCIPSGVTAEKTQIIISGWDNMQTARSNYTWENVDYSKWLSQHVDWRVIEQRCGRLWVTDEKRGLLGVNKDICRLWGVNKEKKRDRLLCTVTVQISTRIIFWFFFGDRCFLGCVQ